MTRKIRLHLGCGLFYKKGYINIDKHPANANAVDRVFDCQRPLDYNTESVDEILAIHFFEHLKRSGLNRTVKSWYRVLKPGGKLILELPHMGVVMKKYEKAIVNNKFGTADNLLRWVFGNQDHEGQYHYWGWTPESLNFFLQKFEFTKLETMPAQDDTRPKELCFRLEATK